MKITQIRNATQIINTLAKHFLSTRYSRLKEVIRVLPERHAQKSAIQR